MYTEESASLRTGVQSAFIFSVYLIYPWCLLRKFSKEETCDLAKYFYLFIFRIGIYNLFSCLYKFFFGVYILHFVDTTTVVWFRSRVYPFTYVGFNEFFVCTVGMVPYRLLDYGRYPTVPYTYHIYIASVFNVKFERTVGTYL